MSTTDDSAKTTLTPAQAHRAFSWLRISILLALVLTHGLTLTMVLWTDKQNTEQVLYAQTQTTLNQLIRLTSDNVKSYLQASAQLVNITQKNIQTGLIDGNAPTSLRYSFDNTLESASQLSGMYLSHSDGRFILVRRDGTDDFGRFIRVITVKPKRKMITSRYNGAGLLLNQVLNDSKFDPRVRPWYKKSLTKPNTLIWTEPYIFASSNKPGITVAKAHKANNGQWSVIGADIKLSSLTQFLQNMDISPNGRIFITDDSGVAIAASKEWPLAVKGYLPVLKDVGDAPLLALLDKDGKLTKLSDVTTYSVNEQHYAAVARTLDMQPGLRWTIGVYAPTSDFTQGLQDINGRHMLFILLASVVSILVAWPLATQTTRPFATLQKQATTDPLTGLRNRASFLAELDTTVKSVYDKENSGNPIPQIGVAIFDLDGFKSINDTFGHATGDDVLHAVGARMLSAVRVGDTLGRLGGDEFALIIQGKSREEVRLRVEGVLDAIARKPITVDGIEHEVKSTAGLVFQDMEPLESVGSESVGSESVGSETVGSETVQVRLLSRADVALIRGKRRGKGRVWVDGEITMPTLFR